MISMQFFALALGLAGVPHELEKRTQPVCIPTPPSTMLFTGDCAIAIAGIRTGALGLDTRFRPYGYWDTPNPHEDLYLLDIPLPWRYGEYRIPEEFKSASCS